MIVLILYTSLIFNRLFSSFSLQRIYFKFKITQKLQLCFLFLSDADKVQIRINKKRISIVAKRRYYDEISDVWFVHSITSPIEVAKRS